MSVLLLSADLMISSQLTGPAQQQGIPLQTVSTTDAVVERCSEESVALVVLDLGMPGLDFAALIESLRSCAKQPGAIVAFGPHVHENKLAAAREAGCDEVFSRGQFFSAAGEIFARYAKGN